MMGSPVTVVYILFREVHGVLHQFGFENKILSISNCRHPLQWSTPSLVRQRHRLSPSLSFYVDQWVMRFPAQSSYHRNS